MKRFFVFFALILGTCFNAEALIMWNTHTCGGGANGYMNVFYSQKNGYFHSPLQLHVTERRLTCEDPGSSPCDWPAGTGPALTIPEEDIKEQVADQISMGTLSGHTRTDGQPGTMTIENMWGEWDGAEGYLWSVDPISECVTIVMLPQYNGGE